MVGVYLTLASRRFVAVLIRLFNADNNQSAIDEYMNKYYFNESLSFDAAG